MTAIRRLAAILAVDVVGYSRLMGEDEKQSAFPQNCELRRRDPQWPLHVDMRRSIARDECPRWVESASSLPETGMTRLGGNRTLGLMQAADLGGVAAIAKEAKLGEAPISFVEDREAFSA